MNSLAVRAKENLLAVRAKEIATLDVPRLDRRAYKGLVGLFKLLAEGETSIDGPGVGEMFDAVQAMLQNELVRWCGSPAGPRAAAPTSTDNFWSLRKSRKIEIADSEAFTKTWENEHAFCKLGNWSTDHAEYVQLLLDGGADILEEAEAAKQAFQVLGNNLVAYRTGLAPAYIKDLRDIAALPESVRRLFAEKGLKPSQVRNIKGSEEEMLRQFDETETGTEPAIFDETVDLNEAVVACLKLSAATAEMVAAIDKKVSKLLKELGCKDD